MGTEYLSRLLQFLLSSFIFDAPGLSAFKTRALRLFFEIGEGSYLSRGSLLYSPHTRQHASLSIGKNVGIEHHCDIDYSGGLKIEDSVWISEGVLIATHHHQIQTTALKESQPISFTPLHIGKDAWIGARAVILGSVSRIGEGAVIGANSVLTKNVGDWEVWAGNPAKFLRKRSPGEEEAL